MEAQHHHFYMQAAAAVVAAAASNPTNQTSTPASYYTNKSSSHHQNYMLNSQVSPTLSPLLSSSPNLHNSSLSNSSSSASSSTVSPSNSHLTDVNSSTAAALCHLASLANAYAVTNSPSSNNSALSPNNMQNYSQHQSYFNPHHQNNYTSQNNYQQNGYLNYAPPAQPSTSPVLSNIHQNGSQTQFNPNYINNYTERNSYDFNQYSANNGTNFSNCNQNTNNWWTKMPNNGSIPSYNNYTNNSTNLNQYNCILKNLNNNNKSSSSLSTSSSPNSSASSSNLVDSAGYTVATQPLTPEESQSNFECNISPTSMSLITTNLSKNNIYLKGKIFYLEVEVSNLEIISILIAKISSLSELFMLKF